ncbi:MAG: hypothetical protein JNK38_27665 [Acidobacteria bacterium]|nr:hypothetical protein [Acidobacteriota bacterium]
MFSNVISKTELRQVGKRALLVAVLLLALILVGVIVSAVSAQRAEKNFALAADFPRGALVYAQFKDLPGLLAQWNESQLKERYLNSINFQQMQSRHLAMKLLSRWEEFNDAAGFPLDLAAFASVADNQAAIAVYDIGRLDLVLVAPISQTALDACVFFQGKDNFAPVELPDGTTYYLRDVEADRGRQKQHLAFASVKGRFVLATNESLLLRTVANINQRQGQRRGQIEKKDRLSDEPDFQALAKTVTPHFVTVWVAQSKLNDDWYFRHYWLMSDVAELKTIRAGMFDLELQQTNWVERREFLLNGKSNPAPIAPQLAERFRKVLPADTPFIQFRAIADDANTVAQLVSGALFDGQAKPRGNRRSVNWQYYGDSDFDVSLEDDESYGESRYAYLDSKFDSTIDEAEDEEDANDFALRQTGEQRFARQLHAALQAAKPVAATRLAQPKAIEGPLFAEFARASVIALQNPALLEKTSLERAIADLTAARLMVAGSHGEFEWKTRTEQGTSWREMELPMLGRSVGYGLRDGSLIVSNNPGLLTAMMTARRTGARETVMNPFHDLTVIRFDQRAVAFDEIFARLESPQVKAYWQQRSGDESAQPSLEFFSGELAGLFDVVAPLNEIRVQRVYSGGRLREEVRMNFMATIR